jgi:uncharacterized delta-60 repeat protein
MSGGKTERNTLWLITIWVFIPLSLLAQIENWVYRYNGSANSTDGAYSVVYGLDGNVYAAGASQGTGTSVDVIIVSLASSGDTNWTYRYNGPGNGRDEVYSIVYGLDDNIYAAGRSFRSGNSYDLLVISLTTDGDTNWIYTYNGPGDSADVANAIAYGSDGNIYAAGTSIGNNIYDDFLVISLNNTGDTNWTYTYDGPMNGMDVAYSIAYGLDGNIYAAGQSADVTSTFDLLVISLANTGDVNWIYTFNGPRNQWDIAYSVVYGLDGNIYAAGGYNLWWWNPVDPGLVVVSLTATGDTNWVYMHSDSVSGGNARSVVYGLDGNIYAAGGCNGPDCELITVSLTAAGDTNWVYTYNGPGPAYGTDVANSVNYGLDGNIYVAGYGLGANADFLVINLATTGDTNWLYTYDGPANATDVANSIVYGSDGNIYAAGRSTGSSATEDLVVISLSPSTGMEEEDQMIYSKHGFVTNIFRGPLQIPEGKKCRVFDITGRVVEPSKIQPGIYFIEVDGVVTQKVVKVR